MAQIVEKIESMPARLSATLYAYGAVIRWTTSGSFSFTDNEQNVGDTPENQESEGDTDRCAHRA